MDPVLVASHEHQDHGRLGTRWRSLTGPRCEIFPPLTELGIAGGANGGRAVLPFGRELGNTLLGSREWGGSCATEPSRGPRPLGGPRHQNLMRHTRPRAREATSRKQRTVVASDCSLRIGDGHDSRRCELSPIKYRLCGDERSHLRNLVLLTYISSCGLKTARLIGRVGTGFPRVNCWSRSLSSLEQGGVP